MSFGGFTSAGEKMVGDGLCSYNIISTGAMPMSQTLQRVHSSYSQPLFTTPPLSLALVCSLSLSLHVILYDYG